MFCNFGHNPPINVVLKIISSNCVPALIYGTSALSLSASELKQLTFTYNSAFCKIFKTSCIQTIEYCQYYCNYLPLPLLIDCNRFCYLAKLLLAGKLYFNSALDSEDYNCILKLSDKYGFKLTDSRSIMLNKLFSICQFRLLLWLCALLSNLAIATAIFMCLIF